MLKWRNICCCVYTRQQDTFLIHFSKHVLVSFLRVLKRLHHNTITQRPWDPATFIFMFYFCECAPVAPSPNCQTLQINWDHLPAPVLSPPLHWFREINSIINERTILESDKNDKIHHCLLSDSLRSDSKWQIKFVNQDQVTGWPCSCINLCVYQLI